MKPPEKASSLNAKPAMNRSLLHPDSNKAIAMDSQGAWFSYSRVPVADENKWQRQALDNVCFRIPSSHAPEWLGDWRESLVVFED